MDERMITAEARRRGESKRWCVGEEFRGDLPNSNSCCADRVWAEELDPQDAKSGTSFPFANGEIASLMNELEAIAQRTGAAVVVAHHFAKGDRTAKNAMDRMSAAGAWARDPDSIVVLTPGSLAAGQSVSAASPMVALA